MNMLYSIWILISQGGNMLWGNMLRNYEKGTHGALRLTLLQRRKGTLAHGVSLPVGNRWAIGASQTRWQWPILSQVTQPFRREWGFYRSEILAWCLAVPSNYHPGLIIHLSQLSNACCSDFVSKEYEERKKIKGPCAQESVDFGFSSG